MEPAQTADPFGISFCSKVLINLLQSHRTDIQQHENDSVMIKNTLIFRPCTRPYNKFPSSINCMILELLSTHRECNILSHVINATHTIISVYWWHDIIIFSLRQLGNSYFIDNLIMFSHIMGFMHHSFLMGIMQNLKQQYFIISNVCQVLYPSMPSPCMPI
jgi:hypothetical protein